jgi:hypothetical protein
VESKNNGRTAKQLAEPYAANNVIINARNQLILKPSTLLELFKPVVANIVAKVSGMVALARSKGTTVNNIFLVGGFGTSDYLHNQLVSAFGTGMVTRIPNCDVAVVCGAVRFGVDQQLFESRRMRATFGMGAQPDWRSEFDTIQWRDKWGSTMIGRPAEILIRRGVATKTCDDVFSTFVTKDEEVKTNQAVTKDFAPADDACTTLFAPIYSINSTAAPRFTDEYGVSHLGSLSMPIGTGDMSRSLRVDFVFGGTELVLIVTNLATKESKRRAMTYISERMTTTTTTAAMGAASAPPAAAIDPLLPNLPVITGAGTYLYAYSHFSPESSVLTSSFE